MTETIWPTQPKIFTLHDLLQKKFSNSWLGSMKNGISCCRTSPSLNSNAWSWWTLMGILDVLGGLRLASIIALIHPLKISDDTWSLTQHFMKIVLLISCSYFSNKMGSNAIQWCWTSYFLHDMETKL